MCSAAGPARACAPKGRGTRRIHACTRAAAQTFAAAENRNAALRCRAGPGRPVLQGQLEDARKEFERAARLRSGGRPCIAGTLALAALLFSQRGYKEALEL